MEWDILIECIGKTWLLHSETDTGRQWIERRIPADKWRQALGWTVAVEDCQRARDLCTSAMADGLRLGGMA